MRCAFVVVVFTCSVAALTGALTGCGPVIVEGPESAPVGVVAGVLCDASTATLLAGAQVEARIAVTVTDEAGDEASDVAIAVVDAVADEKGTFSLVAPAGTAFITIRAEGFQRSELLQVRAGEESVLDLSAGCGGV